MGKKTTLEVARILNDDDAVMARLSITLKLSIAIEDGDVRRVRNCLSALGKTKRGFDDIDRTVLDKAYKIMKDNGYVPLKEAYRTYAFTVIKLL